MNARVALIFAVLLFFPPSSFAEPYSESYSGGFDQEWDAPQSVDDYMSDGWSEERDLAVPLLGMTVREEMGRIASGAPMAGVGVMTVASGGPANRAGIGAPHTVLRTTAITALLAGGMFFPPAMFGALALSRSGIGDSHDLIVAVDGYRTHNLFQFRHAIDRAAPGQILYLRVIRSGERREFRVEIPPEAGLGLTY